MNKQAVKGTLIGVGLFVLAGAVGAQAYYSHELAKKVAATSDEIGTPPVPDERRIEAQDPWAAMHAEMMREQARMDQAFNTMFARMQGPKFNTQNAQNSVTVDEQGDNYVVKADIPGAKEGDIDVQLNGRLLSISSQSTGGEQKNDDKGNVVQQENYTSSFEQAFTLPGPVNAAQMKTHFDKGVLTVTIPKETS